MTEKKNRHAWQTWQETTEGHPYPHPQVYVAECLSCGWQYRTTHPWTMWSHAGTEILEHDCERKAAELRRLERYQLKGAG